GKRSNLPMLKSLKCHRGTSLLTRTICPLLPRTETKFCATFQSDEEPGSCSPQVNVPPVVSNTILESGNEKGNAIYNASGSVTISLWARYANSIFRVLR